MPGLSPTTLQEIAERDEATGDGVYRPDDYCALDRHILLAEVSRLRDLVARLKSGRPIAIDE
jgi:hypothetical protein